MMTRKPRILLMALLAASLLSLGAQAQAAGWVAALKNTPAEDFDDEDLRLLLAAAAQSLNAEGEPAPVRWDNPATGAGGRFLVQGSSTAKNGQPCRSIRFWLHSKRYAEKTALWNACKDEQGRWRLGRPR
ncbi:hypothetical protein G8A07_24075 [Roseateles sp. DAIF2]|uniref:RT0821/Lpp0805 family surface protein n=1 Tax=Roseateles sp. DAIF2 TaxID=2714952 RepID=UPI0018A2FA3B|nr:RT0821/Lpp0805 family surface protein [Roseateles sp. DAIF2]QPF75689.1 hypothetical protein G8A07_24075 [Roseateles sp. DAIF2]